MIIRKATNRDSDEIISLISTVYDEYGEIMFTDGADKYLLDIRENYLLSGGDFIVLENKMVEIIGTHATLPKDISNRLITFRSLYLKKSCRGKGAGKKLMDWAVKWAIDQHFKDKEVGETDSLHGELEGGPYDIFGMKEPDYIMKIMSTYGGLYVKD